MEFQDNLQPKFVPDRHLKLLDQVRQVFPKDPLERYHHYSYRTEEAYCCWIVRRILWIRFIKYHWGKIHPTKMGKKELCTAPCGESFLSHLATNQIVPKLWDLHTIPLPY